MVSFSKEEAKKLVSKYTAGELKDMLGPSEAKKLFSSPKETKPVNLGSSVSLPSFADGGSVRRQSLPLSGKEVDAPSGLREAFSDLSNATTGLIKGGMSVGFGLPGDTAALLAGLGSFIGVPGQAFFDPDYAEEAGFGSRFKRAAGVTGDVSSTVGSMALEEAAIDRVLDDDTLDDRQKAFQIEGIRTGAFTGPLTPAALGLAGARKVVTGAGTDVVDEGVGSLDAAKEAANLNREEQRRLKRLRDEAASFVPEEAKLSAGQSTVNEQIIKSLGEDLETRPFLTDMVDNTNDMKYSFKTGRLIFNPESGLGMSQAGKPRNSLSVLNSFERLGVSKNELKQTGMLDLLTKNKTVTLQDLQDAYSVSKPDFKMVRTADVPEGDGFSGIQRMTHGFTENYSDSDAAGYDVIDVMSHAFYDEGQPFIKNILLEDPHYTEVDVGYQTATNPTVRSLAAENSESKVPIPNSMFHTRGSTVLFNEGTDLQSKFPKGAQIIEEIQDDYLSQANLVKEAQDPSTLPRLKTNFNNLQTRVNTDASELSKLLRDDNLMSEAAAVVNSRYPEILRGVVDFNDPSSVPDQMRALFHVSFDDYAMIESGLNAQEVRQRVDRLGGRIGGQSSFVPKSAFGDNIAEDLNPAFVRDFREILDDVQKTPDEAAQLSTPLRTFNIDKLFDVQDGLDDLGKQRKLMNRFDALSEISLTNPDLTRKLEVELPKFNARKKELENTQYNAEMELQSFNRVTEENVERYTRKIDSINDLINKIEGDLPDTTYRHSPNNDGELITVSRERMLDIQAERRDRLQNQLRETERRSYSDNSERMKRETALNKANNALREHRDEFISKNPEMSEFLETRDVDGVTGAVRLETLAPDSVFEDQTTTALYMLKQELALAQKKGLSGIIMPDYRNIAKLRGVEGEAADATFKRTYELAPEKLTKELEKLGFEVGKIDVNYSNFESRGQGMETFPSRYIKIPENMPDFEPEIKLAKGGLVKKQVV